MSDPQQSLGAAELDVLKYIFEEFPISVRDVVWGLQESHGYARTTVLTVLERLRKKGFLSRERMDGVNHYRPCMSQKKIVNAIVGRFVDEMLGGSIAPFIAYLNHSRRLTTDDLHELKTLIKKFDDPAHPA